MIGEMVGSRNGEHLYDIMDEVEANRAGFAMSNQDARGMVFNKKINSEWFKQDQMKGGSYSSIRGKEQQVTLNTLAAVFLKYTNDTYILVILIVTQETPILQ
jgi:hypothetical protein